ncbi:MAG: class I SAM-dependent methyltransferase [Thermodesulfobacteriota bacterium]
MVKHIIKNLFRCLQGIKKPCGIFHEDWYADTQLKKLKEVVKKVRHTEGKIIEIGCWEGKSTITIANTCYPENLDCVDTWKGNVDEDSNHSSVKIAASRDVFKVFRENMRECTKGNLTVYKQDCFEYLDALRSPVKFCHIDAAHDYKFVRKTIELLLPKLVLGGILCGDDYKYAHIGRKDLDGGVERAVKETLTGFHVADNFWWYCH